MFFLRVDIVLEGLRCTGSKQEVMKIAPPLCKTDGSTRICRCTRRCILSEMTNEHTPYDMQVNQLLSRLSYTLITCNNIIFSIYIYFFFQIKMYKFITQKQKFIISIHVLQQINRIFSLADGVGCLTVGVVCQVDNQSIKGQINSSVFGSVLLLALVCVFARIFQSTGFDVFKCLCRDL